MSQQIEIASNSKKLIKFLTKTIKKILIQNEIVPSTRQGNKELKLIISKLGKSSFSSWEQAKIFAEKLGATIVEVSQQKDKKYLDKGVIRQIVQQKQFPIVAEVAEQKAIASATKETPAKQEPVSEPIVRRSETIQATEEDEDEIDAELVESSLVTEEDEDEIDVEPAESSLVTEEDEDEIDVELAESSLVTEEDEDEVDAEPAESSLIPEEDEDEADAEPAELPSKTESASMNFKDRIAEDIKQAMKAKDKIRLETVRSLKKALIEKEVAIRPSGQDSLTQEQEIELLAQQAKQRRESIEQYRQAGRDDLADKESQELAIIETYLPEQLSDDEVSATLDEIIASVGASSAKDMGKVMGVAMKQLKGKADGKKIQALVKNKLEG